MAKQRSGYVYEETTWHAVVTYRQADKTHKVKQRAKSKKHAQQLAKEIALDLKQRLGPRLKTKGSALAESAGWYARVTYTDEGGRRKNIKRRAENKTAAKEALKQIIRKLDDHGPSAIDGARVTFSQLVDHYEKNYVVAPRYLHGRKVAGLRSHRSLKSRLAALGQYFGKYKLRVITHGDLERFRADRLNTPVVVGKNTRGTDKPGKIRTRQRSIAAVNREMSLLRRVLNVAKRNKWISENPFESGDPLIKPGDEKPRERILTRDEESRLIAACDGKRSHLRPIVICALDTGMRKGEILKLVASDLDFDNRLITVRAFNTKTMRERQVAMSERLAHELEPVCARLPEDKEVPVFGIMDDIKRSFNSARSAAGLPEVRFHDLRHTHATRLVASHMPLAEVGRMLGHTQANTTFRYVNANVETARRAALLIDEFNSAEAEETVIN